MPPTAVGANSVGGPAASPGYAAPAVVPFDQASHQGTEPATTWIVTPTTAQQTNGPIPLPAQGYLRFIDIDIVTSTASTGGTPVIANDGVANILSLVRLQDTNGAPLCELTGFNLEMMMTYGGFAGCPDPRDWPTYTATATAPSITLKIPVEIAPNGLGALANQSASAAYRLTLTVGSIAEIWSTAPSTTAATFTIRVYTEFWTLPSEQDMLGRQQVRKPPYNGTAQYFTQQMNNSVATGSNNTRITRMGNLLRTLIFVGRVTGTRSDSPYPDPFTLNWDARDLIIWTQRLLTADMRAAVEQLSVRDTGVFAFLWSEGEGRHVGENEVNSWLPTVTATRLEVVGSSAAAGTLDILVNDVSVAETEPAARAVETSATGYNPPAPAGTSGV